MSTAPQPIVVSPREACTMLSIGLTKFYELTKRGDLVSYKDGKTRKVTVQSIYDYVNKNLLAQDPDENPEYSVRFIHPPT